MDKYVSLNHMSRCSAQLTDNSFLLPHHGVSKANTAAPKIRVIFNGSAKAANGISINDVLHSGQNLLPDLADLLTKWRSYSIVFVADIKHIFRCILVHPDDQVY